MEITALKDREAGKQSEINSIDELLRVFQSQIKILEEEKARILEGKPGEINGKYNLVQVNSSNVNKVEDQRLVDEIAALKKRESALRSNYKKVEEEFERLKTAAEQKKQLTAAHKRERAFGVSSYR